MTNTYTHLTPAFRFTPDKLMEMVPNVGSIIDLTATDKYYNPALFTTRGIRHTKIGCGGRGTIPFEAIVHRFFDVVDAFLLSAHSQGEPLFLQILFFQTGYYVLPFVQSKRFIVAFLFLFDFFLFLLVGKVLMVHCTHVKLNKQHTKKLNMNFDKLVKMFQVIKLKV
ncbi:uncharacterized protein LOC124310670 isoform X1 [Daphnia pulicaria]|uniref:uncharacterized protein LOC124310670 isoform X1 n=1 Tax=Daphnia pulicaria TaxID=35523 RepID=UPI001EE9CB8C|nr:uncharacterized protein LOC124310670 isoform X1 [Daphnia pulicaria]